MWELRFYTNISYFFTTQNWFQAFIKQVWNAITLNGLQSIGNFNLPRI